MEEKNNAAPEATEETVKAEPEKTEKAEKAGHYSAYISSGQVGHEGGDLLVRDTLDRIQKMFEEA